MKKTDTGLEIIQSADSTVQGILSGGFCHLSSFFSKDRSVPVMISFSLALVMAT